MGKFLLVVVSALTFTACSKISNLKNPVKNTGIVNGVVTSDYPEVIQLRMSGYPACTATAVSDSTIITAAHCMGDLSYVDDNGVEHAARNYLASEKVDAAVVVFDKGTFKAHSSVMKGNPQVGDVLVMVGYGQFDYINNLPPDGLKRVGRNYIRGFANRSGTTLFHRMDSGDYLHYRSAIEINTPVGEDSMTGRGDSGGPMFINGELAGCTSFGATRETIAGNFQLINEPNPDNSKIYEYDTNLTSPDARDLFSRAQREIGAVISDL